MQATPWIFGNASRGGAGWISLLDAFQSMNNEQTEGVIHVMTASAVSRLNFRVRTSELERQRGFFLVPRGVSGSDNRQMGQWRFGKVRCQKKRPPLSPGNVSTFGGCRLRKLMLAK